MQARDTRIAELEAQTATLTAAHDRLARAREMMVVESVRSRDILHSATDRLRCLRRPSSDRGRHRRAGGGAPDDNKVNLDAFSRNPCENSDNTHGGASRNHSAGAYDGCAHGGVGVVLGNSGGDAAATDYAGAWIDPSSTNYNSNPRKGDIVVSASVGSSASRPFFLNSSVDSSINNAAAGASRFAAEYHGEPVSVRASMPNWRSSSVGVESAREAGSPVQQAILREGTGEWEEEDGGDGVASAAMEMLREVERMQVRLCFLQVVFIEDVVFLRLESILRVCELCMGLNSMRCWSRTSRVMSWKGKRLHVSKVAQLSVSKVKSTTRAKKCLTYGTIIWIHIYN